MDIIETDDAWRAMFFPYATPTNMVDSWADKGFRTQLGIQEGVNVPQYIDYDSSRYTREQAIAFAKNIRTCGRCKILNKDVDEVRTISMKDNYQTAIPRAPAGKEVNTEVAQLRSDYNEMKAQMRKMVALSPTRKSATQELASKIAMDMFKAQLTDPGRIEMALIFDDDSFIDDLLSANPTEEEMMGIEADMADFWAGDIGRYRNVKQLRQYAKTQRNNIRALRGEEIEEDEDDEEDTKSVAVRRKHGKRTKVRVV